MFDTRRCERPKRGCGDRGGFYGAPCEIYVDESDVERARELVIALQSSDERGRI